MQRHPALGALPLVWAFQYLGGAFALVRACHPYTDAILTPLATHAESSKRADRPFFDGRNEAAHIGRPALEIEHDITHALARTVIGELPAAAGDINGKAGLQQLLRLRRCAGRVKGRVLEQPDKLGRLAARNGGRARSHGGERRLVVDEALAYAPLDRRRAGWREKPNWKIVARVNAPV